jgi:hypothetical protein
LKSYRDKRRLELQRLSQLYVFMCVCAITAVSRFSYQSSRPRFGTVKELSQFELLSETDDEDKRVWVVVHLYEQVGVVDA